MDAKTLGEELAAIVKAATQPLLSRIDGLEKALAERGEPKDGEPGKDADPEAVAALVHDRIKAQLDAIQEAAAILPELPELPDIPAMIALSIAEAVSHLPKPQDGAPGEDGDKGDPGRDGLDVKDLFRADGGRLIAVMSDGTTKDLGRFVGADGKDGDPGRDGKDGVDGLGFEDLSFEEDDYGRPLAKFQRGDVVKTFRLPCIVDRGVYKAAETYLRGDAVSYGGGLWIAQKDAPEGRPDGGEGWRLAVKKGRDGRDTEAKKVL